MNLFNYLRIILKRWKAITIITSIVVLIVLIYSFTQPFEYKSTVQLLVIQNPASGLDPYTAIKSAEQIGETLVKVVYTSSFIEKAQNPSLLINNIFPADPIDIKKSWRKMVNVYVISGNGIIQIEAYHPDQNVSLKIARAVANVLITQGNEYLGGGHNVEVKLIDSPLTSRYPVRPNILLNLAGAFALGLLFSGCYLFLTLDNIDAEMIPARQIQSPPRLSLSIKNLPKYPPTQKIDLANPSTEEHLAPIAPILETDAEIIAEADAASDHKAVIHNFFTEQLIEDHYLKNNNAAGADLAENKDFDFSVENKYDGKLPNNLPSNEKNDDTSRIVNNLPTE